MQTSVCKLCGYHSWGITSSSGCSRIPVLPQSFLVIHTAILNYLG